MFSILTERLRQKYRTVPYPAKDPVLPARFMGRPILHAEHSHRAPEAVAACPTGAFSLANGRPTLDMGRCIFCGACAHAAPGLVSFDGGHRMAGLCREELYITPHDATPQISPNGSPNISPNVSQDGPHEDPCPPVTPQSIRALFKRSFRIREVSAAGCNACEADCNVLTTVVFDLARFGIDFVASPRHADAVLVTGPVPRNMRLGLEKCYAAMPGPKVVIAVGACAISGGLFRETDQDAQGVAPHLDIDLFIPGCPPSPYTILGGLLRFLQRDKQG